MVTERIVKLPNRKDRTVQDDQVLTASHRAWRVIEQVSGVKMGAWLQDWLRGGGVGNIQEAAYGLLESWRRTMREPCSFDEFLEQLPDVETPEWREFKSAVEAVIDECFFPDLVEAKRIAAMTPPPVTEIPTESPPTETSTGTDAEPSAT